MDAQLERRLRSFIFETNPAFVKRVDIAGQTALHCAKTVESVRLLINTAEDKSAYVRFPDGLLRTALHYAQTEEIARLLIKAAEENSAYVRLTDLFGKTALHYAQTVEIARLLIDTVEDHSAYVGLTDNVGQSALHKAEIVEIARLLIDTAENKSAYVGLTDSDGQTALHYAKTVEMARFLINTAEDKSAYVGLTDNVGRTALHYAQTVEIARLLIDTAEDKSAYVGLTDNNGRTALHYATKAEMFGLLIDTAEDKQSYVNIADSNGNTAVMFMIIRNELTCDELRETLERIDYEVGLKALFDTKNQNGQNIFHLVFSSLSKENFSDVLGNHLDEISIEDQITADIFGNTLFHYLGARFSVRLFADLMLKLPANHRRILLTQTNFAGTNCVSLASQHKFDIDTYLKQVLCSDIIKFQGEDVSFFLSCLPVYNKNFPQLIKYLLNEYLLTDLKGQTQHRCLPWLYYDGEVLPLSTIQSKLYKMDVPANHSRLKVMVVICPLGDGARYVSPPGPDFLIMSVVPSQSGSPIYSELLEESFSDVDTLLSYLKSCRLVKYININSTMGRHYKTPDVGAVDNRASLLGGKALIICNTAGREFWEKEHQRACQVLEHQLGLKVEKVFDVSADEMLRKIKEFSQSAGHGSLAALVIMSHGDKKGNICGNADGTHCSVQDVVDALCQPDLESVTKVAFLTFCRGKIGFRCNRVNEGWETTKLKPLIEFSKFSPILGGVRSEILEEVRAHQPFPSVDVPVNCYLCYSTLPDSWSFRYNPSTRAIHMMWPCLSDHLSELCKREVNKQIVRDSVASPMESENINTGSYAALEGTESTFRQGAVVSNHPVAKVELVSLLTDLSGIVREKSEFTQYLNFCYALNKESKPVVLQVLPANPS